MNKLYSPTEQYCEGIIAELDKFKRYTHRNVQVVIKYFEDRKYKLIHVSVEQMVFMQGVRTIVVEFDNIDKLFKRIL